MYMFGGGGAITLKTLVVYTYFMGNEEIHIGRIYFEPRFWASLKTILLVCLCWMEKKRDVHQVYFLFTTFEMNAKKKTRCPGVLFSSYFLAVRDSFYGGECSKKSWFLLLLLRAALNTAREAKYTTFRHLVCYKYRNALYFLYVYV